MVSSVNTNDYTRLMNNKGGLASPIESDYNNIFDAADAASQGGYFNSAPLRKKLNEADSYITPREEYEKILSEQGVFGKFVNNIKNNIPLLSLLGMKGSYEIEAILDDYENGDVTEEYARNAVNDFKKNQKILTQLCIALIVMSTFLLGFIALKYCEFDTSIAITLSSIASSISGLLGGITELATKNVNGRSSNNEEAPKNKKILTLRVAKRLDSDSKKDLMDYVNTSLILSTRNDSLAVA